ncbi:MAG: choice-of-anchor A family protein, partial [Eubacteriales bacterium]|nr:choice-of-anchor A family protein [Eubacteriales bacterium]
MGAAVEFGVFVEGTTSLRGHMDSNLATEFFDMGSDFGAGKYSNDVCGMVYVADKDWVPSAKTIKADTLIVGNPSGGLYADHGSNWSVADVKIGTRSDIGEMWHSDETQPFINLKEEFNRLRKLSLSYSMMDNSEGVLKNGNEIDFSDVTQDVAYYNMDSAEYGSIISGINILTGNVQLCVINVDMKDCAGSDLLLQRTKIDGIGTGANSYNCNKVIWNFYGNNEITVMCDETTGTILSPDNDFYMANTSAGRFIVKNFSNGGEAHFTFRFRV